MSADVEAVLAAGSPALYTAFVLAGGSVGGALIAYDARAWAVSPRQRHAILAVAMAGGLLGSAIPAFLAGGLVSELAFAHLVGPKSILGGLVAGFAAVAAFKRALGIDAPTSDAFARGTPLMMGIGRIGCSFGHCCFGREVAAAWGVDAGDGVPRFPTQAVEAAGVFVLFLLLHGLHVRDALPDRRIFLFFAAYGALRFGMEILREPVGGTWLGLGAYQWFAGIVAGVGVWQVGRRGVGPARALPRRLRDSR